MRILHTRWRYWLFSAVLASSAAAQPSPDRYFPPQNPGPNESEWQLSQRMRSGEFVMGARCKAFRDYSFMQQHKDVIRTESVVVIKGGELQFEQYAPAVAEADAPKIYHGRYTHESPHILFSASKSITSAIVGAAIQQGLLTEDTRLADEKFYPSAAYRDNVPRDEYEAANFAAGKDSEPNYDKVTVRHLLEMSSGFAWSENYGGDPKHSSVMRLLYSKGIADMERYAAMQPMVAKDPGTLFNYSSGNMSLAMGMVRKAVGDGRAETFPWELLFDRLGMRKAVFERDAVGGFVGSSYVHLRPIDMARVGYLYLNDGWWGADQVLPSGWVEKTHTITDGYLDESTQIANAASDGVYGRTWWLNQDPHKVSTTTHQQVGAPYPSVPRDFYGAFGHYGQYIFVIPSLDMVLVRTAQDRDPDLFSVDTWVSAAITCFN